MGKRENTDAEVQEVVTHRKGQEGGEESPLVVPGELG